MGKFLMTSKKSKEVVEKATSQGGFARFKVEGPVAKALILGPVKEDRSVVFVATVHERFANNKLVGRVASPSFSGEKDKIADMGWKLRDKYKDSKNKKKAELWRAFMPKRPTYVNVLDMGNIEAGPMVYQMSGAVAEVVMDEVKDLGDDLTSICDFDEGRILQIKSNQKPKLQRRYKAKFLDKTANLIEDGVLDDEAIGEMAEKLYDLEKFQPKFNEAEFEAYFEKLKKHAATIGVDLDDLAEEEEEVEEDAEFVDEEEVDEDEIEDIDDDEIEEDEDEVEEDEDDVEEEEVEEDDEDFDDDDFEDDEEEEAPKKKVQKKAAKKKVVKKRRRKA